VLLCAKAQLKAQWIDTLKVLFKNKSSVDIRLESRNSFITNDRALISGIRIGVSFKRKLRLGGGLSWLKSEISSDDYILSGEKVIDTIPKYLKLGYICLYADFVFYKTKRWQLSVPIQAGLGQSWFQHSTRYDLSSANRKYFLLLYEPGITTQFKIFRWLGLGADVGYRFTLKNNKYIGEKLNSPTYAFKLLFWADQLYFEAFPKSKVSQKYGPAVW
jgi:hypothetical protein